jgi:hypothetical protein
MMLYSNKNNLTSPKLWISRQAQRWGMMVFRQPGLWMILCLLLGVILRVIVYISDRCLWIDECMLALNIVTRSWSGLLEPLDWNQGAPLGYLLAVKGITQWVGVSEWSLRSVAFFCSLAGLVGFGVLSRRLLPPWAAVWAVALYAVSPGLVSYSAECKQYACDAATTVGLLVLWDYLHRKGSFWSLASMVLGGMVAIWFSHPAMFVLVGIGGSLLMQTLSQKQTRRYWSVALLGLSWLLSFGVLYSIHLSYLVRNDYLQKYWQEHFLPGTSLNLAGWLWDHGLGWCAISVGRSGALLGGALAIWGGIVLWREQRAWATLVLALLGAALFASALRRYPLAGRLVLFLNPILILMMARGGWSLWNLCSPRAWGVAAFGVLVVLSSGVSECLRECRRPCRSEEIRPLLDVVRQQWQQGDKVLVLRGALPAFLFYTQEEPFPPGVVWANSERFVGGEAWEQWQRLCNSPRLWVLASHYRPEEEAVITAIAEATTQLVGAWSQQGAWLRCYVPHRKTQESSTNMKESPFRLGDQ